MDPDSEHRRELMTLNNLEVWARGKKTRRCRVEWSANKEPSWTVSLWDEIDDEKPLTVDECPERLLTLRATIDEALKRWNRT